MSFKKNKKEFKIQNFEIQILFSFLSCDDISLSLFLLCPLTLVRSPFIRWRP